MRRSWCASPTTDKARRPLPTARAFASSRAWMSASSPISLRRRSPSCNAVATASSPSTTTTSSAARSSSGSSTAGTSSRATRAGTARRSVFDPSKKVMLKIWGRTNSVNVKKVLWAAEELGLWYNRIDAGLQFGVNKTPEYLKMNPTGLVPTIDDDGFVLWESHSIVRYLAAKHGAGKLWPTDLRQRADAEQI